MPRIARNIVDFEVDGLKLRATFKHQHAEEHDYYESLPVWGTRLRKATMVEEITGGVLGSQTVTRREILIEEPVVLRTEYDLAVKAPLIVPSPEGEIKLRHITSCSLSTSADGKEWAVVGAGNSYCSIRDKYRWRKGIKESLRRAITAAGIENEGPLLFAFYTEQAKRVAPVTPAVIVIR
jgi:hypothetical protein